MPTERDAEEQVLVLDLVIVLIFIWEMIQGWRKGILYMLGVVAALALAFILARSFSPALSQEIHAAAEKQGLQQQVETRLAERFAVEPKTSGTSLLDQLEIPSAYRSWLQQKEPKLLAQLEDAFRSGAVEGQRSVREALHQVSGELFQMGSQALAFLLIFLCSFFLLRLLLRLLSKGVNKLPFVGGLNRRLGLVMGFLIAVLFCGLLAGLLPAVKDVVPSSRVALDSSRLLPLIAKSSLYHYLIGFVL